MSEITHVRTEPLNLPLAEPFEITLGTQHEASNILVTVETADSVVGYGEGSPLGPVTGETQGAAIDVAAAMADLLEGENIGEYRCLVETVRETFPGAVSAAFAVETALLDAFCRERGIALAELFGGQPTAIETDLTIPIISPQKAADRAIAATNNGFDHLKIKTGIDLNADIERVIAVANATPDTALKIDANQGWTPKETARFAARIAECGIDLELIEQPVSKADIAGLAETRRRVDIPIAADEALFTPADAIRLVRQEAADIFNVKLGKSGPLAAAEIAAIAQGADIDLMIGCMLESALGIHTSAHVASGLGSFSYIDLDGNHLLADDIIDAADSPIHHINGPGHGVIPTL